MKNYRRLWYTIYSKEGCYMKQINKLKLALLIFIIVDIILLVYFLLKKPVSHLLEKDIQGYVSSNIKTATLYDENFKEVSTIVRGKKIKVNDKKITDENNDSYYKIVSEKGKYLIKEDNFTTAEEKMVKEDKVYVRTYLTVYKDSTSSKILGTLNKGDEIKITGYDKLLDDGNVNKYRIEYEGKEGFIYAKYVTLTKEEALKNYDEENTYQLHANCGDAYKIGTAKNLDFYPVIKPKFEDNVMPTEVRALYLNSTVLSKIDDYIDIAKKANINAFVVDIKDDTAIGYESEVMKEYSPKSYEAAINSFDKYKAAIEKLKNNGFYVIGRITVFKDALFVSDNPDSALMNTSTNMPYLHNGSYWPSGFNRLVWEYNVELAKEAVTKIGFNEIQFDYVRFPDGTYSSEEDGTMDLRNIYNEEKAQAIQKFLMYATDEIHSVGAYVSADVFGESAHNYVTGYGQYWPAISNVVDVISPMPYPDHFNKYEYGFDEPVWTIPYKLLLEWGEYVVNRQKSIPTPATVRSWIQAYDSIKEPKIPYDSVKISSQITALYENGLTGGFMTWNGNSSLSKYEEIIDGLKKEYLDEENI